MMIGESGSSHPNPELKLDPSIGEDIHVLTNYGMSIDRVLAEDRPAEEVTHVVHGYLKQFESLIEEREGLHSNSNMDALRIAGLSMSLGAIPDESVRDEIINEAVEGSILPKHSASELRLFLNEIHLNAFEHSRSSIELGDALEEAIKKVEIIINRQRAQREPEDLKLLLAAYWSAWQAAGADGSLRYAIGRKIQKEFV
ncbi:MAG: hypothetical protein JWO96_344 [Candidatus Saccharibacteria bacterium]|nr:hypothetical protein [Candidatus Saccharibacteria bacterium]